jgi:2'-5' RNA ligase
MDTSDNSNEASVMLALLPTSDEWCQIELPHLTLVYAGLKKDLPPSAFNELAKDAAMLAALTPYVGLRVVAREKFGNWGDGEVDVFRLKPSTELWAMRRAVESWNKSEWPFNPHVTIGPVGSVVDFPPSHIGFDRIMVAWGDESLTFWLKR